MNGNMKINDQETGMVDVSLYNTHAVAMEDISFEANTSATTSGSPVSRSLPSFPPKDSDADDDHRRRCCCCVAWSCGAITCAIISAILVCIIVPVVIWAIVDGGLSSNYNNTADQMYQDFNDFVHAQSNAFSNTGSFGMNHFFGK